MDGVVQILILLFLFHRVIRRKIGLYLLVICSAILLKSLIFLDYDSSLLRASIFIWLLVGHASNMSDGS